jgi:hypothetical protein
MRTIWIICAVVSFSILILVSIGNFEEYKVFMYGHIVQVTITTVPFCLTLRSSGFLKFTLNNTTYDKKLSGNECDGFYVGEKIQLRYLEGYEEKFLFANENPIYSIIIFTLFFVGLGIWSIYYAVKRQPLS